MRNNLFHFVRRLREQSALAPFFCKVLPVLLLQSPLLLQAKNPTRVFYVFSILIIRKLACEMILSLGNNETGRRLLALSHMRAAIPQIVLDLGLRDDRRL